MQCLEESHGDINWSKYLQYLQGNAEPGENESSVLHHEDFVVALKRSMITACYKFCEKTWTMESEEEARLETDSITSLGDLFIFLNDKEKWPCHNSLSRMLCCSFFQAFIHCIAKRLISKNEGSALPLASLTFQSIFYFKKAFLDVICSLHTQYLVVLKNLQCHSLKFEGDNSSMVVFLYLSHDKTVQKYLCFLYDWVSLLHSSFIKLSQSVDQVDTFFDDSVERMLNAIMDCLPTFILPETQEFSDLEAFLLSPLSIAYKRLAHQSFVAISDNALKALLEQLVGILFNRMLIALENNSLESFEHTTLSLNALLKKVLHIQIDLNIQLDVPLRVTKILLNQTSCCESFILAFQLCGASLRLTKGLNVALLDVEDALYYFILYCCLVHQLISVTTTLNSPLFTAYPISVQHESCGVCFDILVEFLKVHKCVIQHSDGRSSIASVLCTVWCSICLYDMNFETKHLLTCFMSRILRWSLESIAELPKQTDVVLLWKDFGRRLLETCRDAYVTLLRTLLYHGLCLDFIRSHHVMEDIQTLSCDLGQNQLGRDARSYITLYPSRLQRFLIDVIFSAFLQIHDVLILDFILLQTEMILERISKLLHSLFMDSWHKRETKVVLNELENQKIETLTLFMDESFSLHHLIFCLKPLLKVVFNKIRDDRIKGIQSRITNIVTQLTPLHNNPSEPGCTRMPSFIGRFSEKLVQLDILCFFLDITVSCPLCITKESFQLVVKVITPQLFARTSWIMHTTLVPWIPRILTCAWTICWTCDAFTRSTKHDNSSLVCHRLTRQCLLLLQALISFETHCHCQQCGNITDFLVSWCTVSMSGCSSTLGSSMKTIAGDLLTCLRETLRSRAMESPLSTLYERLAEKLESRLLTFSPQDVLAIMEDTFTVMQTDTKTSYEKDQENCSPF